MDALGACWLKHLVFEYMSVLNLAHGPWKSCEFWRQLQEGMDSYLRRADVHDDLFLLLYSRISHDMDQDLWCPRVQNQQKQYDNTPTIMSALLFASTYVFVSSCTLFGLHVVCLLQPTQPMFMCKDRVADYGAKKHLEDTYAAMGSCGLLRAKGKKVVLRRWVSWVDALGDMHASWNCLLLIITYLGLQSGLYTKIECPVFEQRARLLQSTAGHRPSEEGTEDAEKQQKCFNSVRLSVSLLADAVKRMQCRLITCCVGPVGVAHGKEVMNIRGEEQVTTYYMAFAQGCYNLVFRKLCSRVGSPKVLADIGFSPNARPYEDYIDTAPAASMSSSSSTATDNPTPVLPGRLSLQMKQACLDEGILASDMYQLTVQIARYRCMSMSHWCCIYPGLFAPLLSHKKAVAQEYLGMAERFWKAMVELEQRMVSDAQASDLHQADYVCDMHALCSCLVCAGCCGSSCTGATRGMHMHP